MSSSTRARRSSKVVFQAGSGDSLEARMPSMNSCRVIFPSWSLSMRRKKSMTRDFLWFIQRMYFFLQTSKSKLANSFSWKENPGGVSGGNPEGAAPTKPPQKPPPRASSRRSRSLPALPGRFLRIHPDNSQ